MLACRMIAGLGALVGALVGVFLGVIFTPVPVIRQLLGFYVNKRFMSIPTQGDVHASNISGAWIVHYAQIIIDTRQTTRL